MASWHSRTTYYTYLYHSHSLESTTFKYLKGKTSTTVGIENMEAGRVSDLLIGLLERIFFGNS